MTVRELIETLEELPLDYPVVVDGAEITEVLLREELYLSVDDGYTDGEIIKLY